jgi:hypothetical protein
LLSLILLQSFHILLCTPQSQSETWHAPFQWWIHFYLKLCAILYYKHDKIQRLFHFKQTLFIPGTKKAVQKMDNLPCSLSLQPDCILIALISVLIMEQICSFQMLVSIYNTARCQPRIPQSEHSLPCKPKICNTVNCYCYANSMLVYLEMMVPCDTKHINNNRIEC